MNEEYSPGGGASDMYDAQVGQACVQAKSGSKGSETEKLLNQEIR